MTLSLDAPGMAHTSDGPASHPGAAPLSAASAEVCAPSGSSIVGSVALFTYNCDRSDGSNHVEWRRRTGQRVTVVALDAPADGWARSTREERIAAAMPFTYTVRWADGFEGSVFEDEILPAAASAPGVIVGRIGPAPRPPVTIDASVLALVRAPVHLRERQALGTSYASVRQLARLSRADVADALGCDEQRLADFEAGSIPIDRRG